MPSAKSGSRVLVRGVGLVVLALGEALVGLLGRGGMAMRSGSVVMLLVYPPAGQRTLHQALLQRPLDRAAERVATGV